MKKIIILGLVLLMVVVFGTAALAKADVQKLVPYGAAYPDASGKAIVNTSMGDVVLEITVSVIGLEPDTEHFVYLSHPWFLLGTFTTNKNGNGHFHINIRWDEDQPTTAHIAINKGPSQTVLIDEDY
jgi:hypothetical protein